METGNPIKHALISSTLWAALLTLLFLFYNRTGSFLTEALLALPFFIIFYF